MCNLLSICLCYCAVVLSYWSVSSAHIYFSMFVLYCSRFNGYEGMITIVPKVTEYIKPHLIARILDH